MAEGWGTQSGRDEYRMFLRERDGHLATSSLAQSVHHDGAEQAEQDRDRAVVVEDLASATRNRDRNCLHRKTASAPPLPAEP